MTLKKLTALLLVLVLAFCSLAACNEDENASSTASTPTKDTSSENEASSSQSVISDDSSNSEEDIVYTYDDALAFIAAKDYENAYKALLSVKDNPDAAEHLNRFKVVYTKRSIDEGYWYWKSYYDEQGNHIKEETYANEELVDVIEYTYDENGNILTEYGGTTDGQMSGKTDYSYDEYNNLVFKKAEYSSGSLEETYYDIEGREIKLITTDREGNTETKEIVYDKSGNIEKVTLTDAENNKTVLEYSVTEGNVVIWYGNYNLSSICKSTYDKNGNVIKEEWSESTTEGYVYSYSWVVQYTYDENNNLLKKVETDAEGTIRESFEYTYDSNNRVITENINPFRGDSYIKEYVYDENGRTLKTHTTYSDGTTNIVDYLYDDCGNLLYDGVAEYSDYLYFYYPDGVPQNK